MNKPIVFAGILLAFASCHLANRLQSDDEPKGEQESGENGLGLQKGNVFFNNTDDQPIAAEEEESIWAKVDRQNADEQPRPSEEPNEQASDQPITHYESKKLDDSVIAEAEYFGEDANGYRKFIRADPDGTEIYRSVGEHIIVNPNGETVYLPDEI